MQEQVSRRKALAALGASAFGSLAGCSTGNLVGSSELDKQLNNVEDAVDPVSEGPHAAIKRGYTSILGPFVPGMGWRVLNPFFVHEALQNEFQIEQPQAFIYDDNGNLGAVEYTALVEELSETPDLFADENADVEVQWEEHGPSTHVYADTSKAVPSDRSEISNEELLTIAQWTEIRPPTDLESGDSHMDTYGVSEDEEERHVDFAFTHPVWIKLRVWVGESNLAGVFDPIDPDFAQS